MSEEPSKKKAKTIRMRGQLPIAAITAITMNPVSFNKYHDFLKRLCSRVIVEQHWNSAEVSPDILAVELYRALCCKFVASDDKLCSLPPRLDITWHAFILETAQYAAFCEDGGRFLHHTAETVDDPLSLKHARCNTTKELYHLLFAGMNAWCWELEKITTAPVEAPAPAPAPAPAAYRIHSRPFNVGVRSLDGNHYTITGNVGSTTVSEVIRKFIGLLGPGNSFPEEHWRVIFAGKQMKLGDTLDDHGIQRESTIHIVQNLRGC